MQAMLKRLGVLYVFVGIEKNKLVQLHYTGCQLCSPIGSFPFSIANLEDPTYIKAIIV